MDFYFVTGLPRTRTAWLANLLTYGPSFCHHELLSTAMQISGVRQVMASLPFKHVGVADSGMGWCWRRVLETFPGAKVVIVNRPWQDASKSYCEYFSANPFPGIETPALPMVEVLCQQLERELASLRRALPNDRCLEICFSDLERREMTKLVWDFLVPTEPFNEVRWSQLDKMRINLVSEKYSPNPAQCVSMLLDR